MGYNPDDAIKKIKKFKGDFIMQTNKNKTRRFILVALIVLLFSVSATGVFALAARWFNQTNKEDNTVTVDQPVTVSVTGAASGGTIMPGVESSKINTVFDISISGSGAQTYKLVIKNITFAFDEAIIGAERDDGYFDDAAELEALFGAGYTDFSGDPDEAALAAFLKDFQVSFNGGAAADLVEGMTLLASAATATDQTVDITAKDELLLIARGGTLTFTLALEIA